MYQYSYNTVIGEIFIAENNGILEYVSFKNLNLPNKETPIIKTAYSQLLEYFEGKRRIFDIPIHLNGTEFQKKVWNALTNIPYGQTVSYKDIAISIGNEKSCRAVGMSNNKNPIAIIIPCHRVIGKNGDLTGYAGGIEIKKYLLNLEKKNSK